MYVRIYWSKTEPKFWDNVENNRAVLLNTDIPGLLARLISQDVADPESVFTILVWKDRESVTRWEQSEEYREVYAKQIKPYISGSQTVSLCEVKAANLDKLLQAFTSGNTQEN